MCNKFILYFTEAFVSKNIITSGPKNTKIPTKTPFVLSKIPFVFACLVQTIRTLETEYQILKIFYISCQSNKN